jgi:hypothetical protein
MAKRLKFKCSKCDRRFSMAAHLGRHMSTMHVSKKAKAAQKKKRRAVAKKRRVPVAKRAKRGAGSDLGDVLGSLKGYQDQLSAQRSEIDSRIQAIDAALAALGAGAAKRVVTRPKRGKGPRAGARPRRGKGARAGTLKDFIPRVLRGRSKGLSVKNIAAGVKKAGYKSKNKRLGHAISKALTGMKNVARVGRGVYRLR